MGVTLQFLLLEKAIRIDRKIDNISIYSGHFVDELSPRRINSLPRK